MVTTPQSSCKLRAMELAPIAEVPPSFARYSVQSYKEFA